MSFSKGAAFDDLTRRFGGPCRVEDVTLSPGVTAIQAAQPDYERISLTLVNLGATTLYVRPQGTASATAGIRLAAGGGAVAVCVADDGLLPCTEWSVISDAVGGVLYRTSVRRESADPV